VLFFRSGGDYEEMRLGVMFFDCIVMARLDVKVKSEMNENFLYTLD